MNDPVLLAVGVVGGMLCARLVRSLLSGRLRDAWTARSLPWQVTAVELPCGHGYLPVSIASERRYATARCLTCGKEFEVHR